MSRLSVVIVNWNTKELLQKCIASVLSQAGQVELEVFVVDNASADGSQDMVHMQFPQVKLVENEENVGFARANNQVFAGCSGDYVLLLNPDTCILGNALHVLVDFMQSHPEAGAIGPKIVHPQMRLRVLSCGYQPGIRTLFNQYFFLASIFPNVPAFHGINLLMGVHDDRVREVEWLSGACLLVRKEVIEAVGPLSEHWFMYAEDMEWCGRMKAAGWTLYHVPEAIIEHYLGAGADKNPFVTTAWVTNLREYYLQRSKPSRFQLAFFDATFISGLALRALIYRLRGKIDRQHSQMWKAETHKFINYAQAAWRATKT